MMSLFLVQISACYRRLYFLTCSITFSSYSKIIFLQCTLNAKNTNKNAPKQINMGTINVLTFFHPIPFDLSFQSYFLCSFYFSFVFAAGLKFETKLINHAETLNSSALKFSVGLLTFFGSVALAVTCKLTMFKKLGETMYVR